MSNLSNVRWQHDWNIPPNDVEFKYIKWTFASGVVNCAGSRLSNVETKFQAHAKFDTLDDSAIFALHTHAVDYNKLY